MTTRIMMTRRTTETVPRARADDDLDDGPTPSASRSIDALASVLERGESKASKRTTEEEGAENAGDARSTRGAERRERGRATPEGVMDASWKPYWSPLSEVYNVPTESPRAAYFLAFVHCCAFAVDLALLRSGASNGGDVFMRLAQFDNAVVYESQWMRAFTASLVDFGLVHAALVNAAFLTIAAEAEALLGTRPFLTVYVLSAAAGGIGSLAMEPSTLHVTSSDGLFGVFGALLLYSALNFENEWNYRGFTVRLLYCAVFAVGFQYLAGVPTEDGLHVVNSTGHLWGFLAGCAMGYAGLSPLFTSGKKFSTPPADGRKNLQDVTAGPSKTFAMLGAASTTLVALSVVVLLKRTLDVDPRDVL